jgi:hypothetical protein
MEFKIVVTLLLSSSIFLSCEDSGTVPNLPKCIETKLSTYQPGCDDGSTVDEYYFQQQVVYVFDDRPCCCDYTGIVVSTSCDTLGFLGGIAGFTHINGEDFANAVFQRTVWP